MRVGDSSTSGSSNYSSQQKHCNLASPATEYVGGTKFANSERIEVEDGNNVVLRLYVDKPDVTEYEYQSFKVEIINQGDSPIILPRTYGKQYNITYFDTSNNLTYNLVGLPIRGYPVPIEPTYTPSCFISPHESLTFLNSTRFGVWDDAHARVILVNADTTYSIQGESRKLQTDDMELAVLPVKLAELTSYLDTKLVVSYPPKVGEEQPLRVIARTHYYTGPYSIEILLPQEIKLVSGNTRASSYLSADWWRDGGTNQVMWRIAEDEPATIMIQPTKAGNYTIQTVLHTLSFDGKSFTNYDTIYFSTSESEAYVSREPSQNAKPAPKQFEANDPVPSMEMQYAGNTFEGKKILFCWPDRPKPLLENKGAVIGFCDEVFRPQDSSETISLSNGNHIEIDINNTDEKPDLFVVDIYGYNDVKSGCIIYLPGSLNERLQPHCDNVRQQVLSYDPTSSAFSIETSAPKGTYIMSVFAQWMSEEELSESQLLAAKSTLYHFKVKIE
jgi:hypothetical protein